MWRDLGDCVTWHHLVICMTWLIHYSWRDSFTMCHDSFTYVPWLIDMCAVTHRYLYCDEFICATRLIHVCGIHVCGLTWTYAWRATYSYVWHDAWLSCMSGATYSYVWHDAWLSCMSGVTYMTQSAEWCDSYDLVVWVMWSIWLSRWSDATYMT